jgi:hypothetical protein
MVSEERNTARVGEEEFNLSTTEWTLDLAKGDGLSKTPNMKPTQRRQLATSKSEAE